MTTAILKLGSEVNLSLISSRQLIFSKIWGYNKELLDNIFSSLTLHQVKILKVVFKPQLSSKVDEDLNLLSELQLQDREAKLVCSNSDIQTINTLASALHIEQVQYYTDLHFYSMLGSSEALIVDDYFDDALSIAAVKGGTILDFVVTSPQALIGNLEALRSKYMISRKINAQESDILDNELTRHLLNYTTLSKDEMLTLQSTLFAELREPFPVTGELIPSIVRVEESPSLPSKRSFKGNKGNKGKKKKVVVENSRIEDRGAEDSIVEDSIVATPVVENSVSAEIPVKKKFQPKSKVKNDKVKKEKIKKDKSLVSVISNYQAPLLNKLFFVVFCLFCLGLGIDTYMTVGLGSADQELQARYDSTESANVWMSDYSNMLDKNLTAMRENQKWHRRTITRLQSMLGDAKISSLTFTRSQFNLEAVVKEDVDTNRIFANLSKYYTITKSIATKDTDSAGKTTVKIVIQGN